MCPRAPDGGKGTAVATSLTVGSTRRRPGLADAYRTLKKVFGLDEFRPGQEEIIRSILDGHDTVGVMPTATGRSLCYLIPAVLQPGITVVVSPLVSPIEDEGDTRAGMGLEAPPMNNTPGAREEIEHLERFAAERRDFVLTTPERLATEELRGTLRQQTIDLVVVDEAHCVSQRGHDFRPACLQIRDAIAAMGKPPVLALTATSHAEVLDDILSHLAIPGARVVNAGAYRPNLEYEVIRAANEPEKREHLVRLLREVEGVGIVYASTVRQVDVLYDLLHGLGFDVAKHHGRVAPRQRKENHERFMAGGLHTMIATSPFGMGMDKPNIRFVIHYNTPASLEGYYQESGRAGRDGRTARCVLFYQREDRKTPIYFMSGRYPRADDIHAVYEALEHLGAGSAAVPLSTLKAAAGSVAPAKARVVVSLLKDLGIAREQRGAHVRLIRSGISARDLDAMAGRYRDRQSSDRAKLERMMAYGQSSACRWARLLGYFGESGKDVRCGVCDNCRHALEEQVAPPTELHKAADR